MENSERTVLAADSSQISDFLRCPRMWYYRYYRNIEPKGLPRNPSMDRGSLIHALLDEYYKNLNPMVHPIQVASNCINKMRTNRLNLDPKIGFSKDELDFFATRFLAYAGNYSANDFRPAISNNIPQSEVGFSIPILDTPTHLFVLEGRIDLITADGITVDHKTRTGRFRYYEYSPQFLSYSLATGNDKVCLNYISLADKADKDTFSRNLFIISEDRRKKWKEKLISIFYRMAGAIKRNEFEMNETSCQGNFGEICQYHELDENIDERFIEVQIKNQFQQRQPWHPWKIDKGGETNGKMYNP